MASNDMFIRMVMSGDASPFLKEVVSAESRFKGALSGMSSQAARMELFDKLKEDAKTAAAEFFKLKKEADALRQAISQSESPGRDMEKMLLATEKALTKAETRMGKTRGSLQDMRHELQAAGVDTRNLAGEQEAMSQRIAAVTQRLNSTRKVDDARQILGVQSAHDVEQQIHQVQAAYQRLVTSGKLSWSEQANAAMAMQQRVAELRGQLAQPIQSGLFSNIKSEVLGTIAAMASLTAAINATKSVLTVGGQYEMLQTQLNNVEKSAVLGAGAMDKLKQMALDTPFGVQGLTQSYTQLKNFGLDPMSGALQAASDQAAKLGGSQETLGRITLALGQAWSKEKLQGEEALQLIEAGVPVWDLLGKKIGKSASELQTLSASGQLGRDSIRQLIAAMEDDAKGAAASNVSTWQGVVSNLQDIWEQFLAEISKNGPMDAAKEQITILMNAIRQSFADGTAVQLGHNIATAINAIGEICRVTVGFVNQHSEAIKLLVETWLGAKILTQAIIWLGGISSALTALQAAASVKTVIGISLNKSGMSGAASEISSLFGLLSKIPSLTTLTFATVGITAAVAAISAINTVLDIQNEKLQRKLKLMGEIDDLQRQGVKDNRSGSETSVLTPDQLSGYSKEDLAKYQNDLKRAHDINNKMATQQYQTVMDKGGDPEKDAEYRKRFDNTILYAKALKDLEKYQANRLQIEERYSKTVDGVRKGQLANLAESLAKEQKLYDKYNDLLKQATDTRLKHQDAWAGKKGTDPAEKAKDPQDMGTTDFFEGQAKASSLSRKAQESLATYKQSGKDEDLRKYQQDAAAAEKQFQSLSDVIDKLREAGKITKGEYDWMNQSAGSLQDGFDAKTENSAKDKLQEVMAKIESLKQAAESVKNLQIGFDTEKGMRDLDSLMASFEQAARQHPIQIPTQFVGPDGKYLTDARKDVGLPATPYSLPAIQTNAAGGLISGPGTGTSDSILSRLSNGEFVMTASAVGHYGPELMEAINQRRLPKFATGGLVGSLPSITDNLNLPDPERLSRPATPAALTPINIHLPGISDPVTMHGSEDAISQLTASARMLNLKQG